MSNNAFILLTSGVFGGAEKRFTQLFEYLSNKFPGDYYFIVTWDLYNKILKLFPNSHNINLIPIGLKVTSPLQYSKTSSYRETNTIDNPPLIKKVFRFFKHYWLHKN